MNVLSLTRRQALGAAAILGTAARPALGQSWQPTQPIRLVVGAAPGGSTDILARFLAERMMGVLGVSIIVENKPGASGILAGEYVTRAPADGHMLMVATNGTHAINPALQPTDGFDPVRDSIGVASIGTVTHLLTVNPAVPAHSVAELITYARAHPGAIHYGSAGVGGPIHLISELFRLRTGTDLVHVPYRGSGPLVADLVAGHIQMGFDNLPSSIGAARSGLIRPLAVSSAKRWPGAPEIPTMAEAGVPDFVVTSWFGLTARKGTPQPIVQRLNEVVTAALSGPGAAERMDQLGADPMLMSPAAFDTFVATEQKRWRTVIEQGGIKAD